MDVLDLSREHLARGAATLAGLVGAYNVLYLTGAFGPVSCWTGYSGGGSASSDGAVTTTVPTVTRGCESGVDLLFGAESPPGGGSVQMLFSWAFVLLALVALGWYGAWTARRYVTWATAVAGGVVTVVGVFSVGWYFLLPTLLLSVAAVTLSVEARGD